MVVNLRSDFCQYISRLIHVLANSPLGIGYCDLGILCRPWPARGGFLQQMLLMYLRPRCLTTVGLEAHKDACRFVVKQTRLRESRSQGSRKGSVTRSLQVDAKGSVRDAAEFSSVGTSVSDKSMDEVKVESFTVSTRHP